MQSRRTFLIRVVEGAAIATAATSPASVRVAAETPAPKPWNSLSDRERIIRLRAIIDKAMRSGDRAQMLSEADALGLPKSSVLALQSVTSEHLACLLQHSCRH